MDVARFGQDMTVFAPFIGGKLQPLITFHGKDLMHTADEVEKLAKAGYFTIIDDTGLGGGVTDRLAQ